MKVTAVVAEAAAAAGLVAVTPAVPQPLEGALEPATLTKVSVTSTRYV
jgi:hypothetical protein